MTILLAIYLTGMVFTAIIGMIFSGWKAVREGWFTLIFWPVVLVFGLVLIAVTAFLNGAYNDTRT